MLRRGDPASEAAGDVEAFEQRRFVGLAVEAHHLHIRQGKRWPVHQALVVFEAEQQLRRVGGDRRQVGRVAAAHAFGECHQGGAVVGGIDGAEQVGRQVEDVADEDVEIAHAVMLQRAAAGYRRFGAELGEQLLDGEPAELRTRDAIAVGEQPVDVETLAAQRQEHAAALVERQRGEMLQQHGIGGAAVKAYLVGGPPLMPEIRFHGSVS